MRPDAVEALVAALQNQSPAAVATAAQTLTCLAFGGLDRLETEATVQQLLRDQPAGAAPSHMEAPGAVSILVGLLSHADSKVQQTAANALRILSLPSPANADAVVAAGGIAALQRLAVSPETMEFAAGLAACALSNIALRGNSRAVAAAGGIDAAAALLGSESATACVADSIKHRAALSMLRALSHSTEICCRIVAAGVLPNLAACLAVDALEYEAAWVLWNLTTDAEAAVCEAMAEAALPSLVKLPSQPNCYNRDLACRVLGNLSIGGSEGRGSHAASAKQPVAEKIAASGAMPRIVSLLSSGEHMAVVKSAASAIFKIGLVAPKQHGRQLLPAPFQNWLQ